MVGREYPGEGAIINIYSRGLFGDCSWNNKKNIKLKGVVKTQPKKEKEMVSML